ncbi:hypothetical protein PFISCL1PPCAC_25991, partial [Pristionchus fissidentatus]
SSFWTNPSNATSTFWSNPSNDKPFLTGKPPYLPQPTYIYSDCLLVGATTIAVCRELLALQSEFFTTLFYGPYMEKSQDVKEIKEVPEEAFIRFIQTLHKGALSSVESALDALVFCDRFMVPRLAQKVLPYLQERSLAVDQLPHALTTVDQVANNEEIMKWVLDQFPSKAKLIEVVHDTVPHLSSRTIQICLEVIAHLDELSERTKYSKIKTMLPSSDSGPGQNWIGIHLTCYDASGKIIDADEAYYAVQHYNQRIHLWDLIPDRYSSVVVNGSKYAKNAEVPYTGMNGEIVPVSAYCN